MATNKNTPPNDRLERLCSLTCLQSNTRKSKPSLLTLLVDAANKTIYPNGVDIFLITEPPTVRRNNKLPNVSNDDFNVFSEIKGRAAIITNKGLISWRCPQYCAPDIIVCQTTINGQLTFLVSMYLDGNNLELPPQFINLIANKGTCSVLIGADSNAHSSLWNSATTNRRGEMVEDFIITNNLQCVNVGNRPTFRHALGWTSIIDITVADFSLASNIFNWKVDTELHISDHFRISYSINNPNICRLTDVTGWDFKRGNWQLFKTDFDRKLSSWCTARYWNADSIEKKLNDFLMFLEETLLKTIPRKKFKRKYKYPLWWDHNLSILRAKCRKLAKIKTPIGRENYTSLRREYKKAIITAKRDGWLKFTSEIKYPSDISKFIKNLNDSKNNALGLLKNNAGDYCNNPTESLNVLLSKFFPGHAPLSTLESQIKDCDGMAWKTVKNSRLDKTFTVKKIKAAFAYMGSYKSAGPDGYKPIIMKHFGPKALMCLNSLFQAIYSTGYIPIEFRKSKVVFIPKPLKKDYGEAGSFRPISLTQFLFKAMERIIEWYLREHDEKLGQISEFQHAYSGSKGTDTALSTLVNLIESAILRKQLCLVVSVDIKGAFDNLAFIAIEKAMNDNNYPPLMIRWFMNFLKNRTAIADVLGVKLCIRPMCGTPQGGVLSSRIWNLAFDPLLKLLNQNSPCAPVGFADDGALCFRGIDPETLVEIAQPKINQAVEWGAKNGLTFSVDKTTAVFFSRQKKFHSHVLPKLKKLTINGAEINPSPSMTYLGVILDQKLNWSLHIDNKVAKAKKFLHLVKPALHHIWGLNPKRMQWIYKQIILPRLTYGCLVWGHSLSNSQKQKIESVERVAMQCYAPTWKKTPTASLQILYNQLPSELDIMYVTIKTYIRCKHIFQNNHWDGIAEYASANSHLKTVKSLCHEINHEGTPLDQFHNNFMMDPFYSWDPPVRTSLTAVGSDDTDDYQINLVDNIQASQDDDPIPTGTFGGSEHVCSRMECCSLHGAHDQQICTPTCIYDDADTSCSRMECCSLHGDHSQHIYIPTTECRHPTSATTDAAAVAAAAGVAVATQPITSPVVNFRNGDLIPTHLIPSSTSRSTQKTLDQYDNNYRLFSQKLKKDDGLFIRVITLKNNLMFLNFTCKILGTTNVIEAILASTYIMCSKLLEHLTKGDTFLCSLEAGYLTIRNSIIRNKHVFNLVEILNQIKNKTGLYTIMEGSKYDWLEYASHDTTYLELHVTPKKDAINQTIMTFLENKWSSKWENLKGHAQTKYWCTGPDPIFSAKLLNLPRQHLGWCVQFFTGHGWWRKHLKLANLCNVHTCRLCKRYDSIESPIHLFSECTELTAIRQEIFNTPYPTTHTTNNTTTHTNSTQLCQVVEFALVGRVCDLIDIDNNPLNVNSSR